MGVIGKLHGKTIFITGASRGIGKAIALRCARDGANIVIAAKTAVPHPKLPGTIYTAAKEIEEAGGQCLPCVVDIQSEDQVKQAVEDTINRFGGIDILVNNASAIHISGTVDTPMKRYDLMNHINTRGTFLCSKYCAPHLLKASNPHILTISPPLNMNPRWFKDHVAYTIAKYGMSMCALGMAEEFKDDGVAVNTLWPKTTIFTAAVEMLSGGEAAKPHCRTTDIMSDAAYGILTKPSKSFTGNFLVDEQFLRDEGCTDFEQYACVKGGELMTDIFVDDDQKAINTGNRPLDRALTMIQNVINADVVSRIKCVFKIDLKDGGVWYLNMKHGAGSLGQSEEISDCQLTTSPDTFLQLVAGNISAQQALSSGKINVTGNKSLATKLETVVKLATARPKL